MANKVSRQKMAIPQRNHLWSLLGFMRRVRRATTASLGRPKLRMLGQKATVVQKTTLSCWYCVSRLKWRPLPKSTATVVKAAARYAAT